MVSSETNQRQAKLLLIYSRYGFRYMQLFLFLFFQMNNIVHKKY